MRLFEAVAIALVGLVSLGLDIVCFFLVVRLITLRWRIGPLLAFDQVGRPIVDPLVGVLRQVLPPDWLGPEPRRSRLATAAVLLAITVCRLAVSSAAHVVVIPF